MKNLYKLIGCIGLSLLANVAANACTITVTGKDSVNVLCFGNSTGIATCTNTGTAPYTFSWSNAATSRVNPGLSAGTYTITVTDANSCTGSATVTITQATAITATPHQIGDIACYGGSTGAVDVMVHGGTSPYTYSWSQGGTSAEASDLSAGTYTLSVVDNHGCLESTGVTVTQPAQIDITDSITGNISCHGDSNGVMMAVVNGGTAPFTYSWYNSNTTNQVSGLSAGSYSITVTDHNSCTASASLTMTQPAPLTIVKDSIAVTPDSTCNGSAWVMVSGGTSPYTYLWTPNGETTDTTKRLCAGINYCCTVTDNRNCSDFVCIYMGVKTGIQNPENSHSIQIYPNPTDGKFNIQWAGAQNLSPIQWSVEVYNELGERVYSQFTINKSQFTIDLSNKANGLYLIRIMNSNGSLVTQQKVVKEE